ncbi:MAG TPA: hypothetical protein ENI97_11085 [Gammaproteobacteria bacterium]|nr:hypothetical protein [Gammaproteobacteria bacterium]
MSTLHHIRQVGAPDPELKTSPIVEDTDEEYDVLAQEIEALPVCYFNNVQFSNGQYACSGSGELLHCKQGLWVREGSCDPDNP